MSSSGERRSARRWAVRWLLGHTTKRAAVGRWDEFVDRGPQGKRSYAVYTPPGLRPRSPVPLIVVLHGCQQSMKDAALGTDVNSFADRLGFVALYPEQSYTDNVQRCWNWFEPVNQKRESGEPAAIARITRRVLRGRRGMTIDPNRVHVMGMSAGGAMAGILAATYPDLYASVGIHSAPQYQAARNVVSALLVLKNGGPDPERQGQLAHDAMGPRARVVPVIVFQGEEDHTVWAGNGDRVVAQWLATSRLATGDETGLDFTQPDSSTSDRSTGGLAYTVSSWSDELSRPVVEYWVVSGLGHAWSGGVSAGSYTDPRGPGATAAMCDFFSRCGMDRDLGRARPSEPSGAGRTRWAALGRSWSR